MNRIVKYLMTGMIAGGIAHANFNAWSGHRTILLNTTATGANVSGEVRNFPVLIRLTSAEAAIRTAAKAGGADIRFSKADDVTPLAYHIESWDSTGAAIWVKVDTIKGNNATQSIRMHWGNAAANDSSRPASVFDTANGYVAVWHMNGAATETNVAGHAELNAAATGTVPAVKGLIGRARSFGGTTENYLSVPNSANGRLNFNAATDYTLSAWVYSEETAIDNRGIFNKGNDQWLIGVYGGAEDKYYDIMTRGNNTWNQAATSAAGAEITSATGIGVWRHVVGVWKGSGTPQDTARIYINGVLANTTFFNDLTVQGRDTTTNVYIGALWENGGLARPYHGRIDQVSASKNFRDSNWVKLAYQNQKPGNSLVDIGTFIEPVAPGAPASVTATLVSNTEATATVTVAWTAPLIPGSASITGYKAMAVSDTSKSCTTTGALTCNITGLARGASYTFAVKATSSAGTGPATNSSAVAVPTSLLPGSFAIRMDGTSPYTYRMPAAVAAVTERLTMSIVDLHGKRVWSRTVNPSTDKVNEITWNGRAANGAQVAAGMYLVRLNAVVNGESVETIRKGVVQP